MILQQATEPVDVVIVSNGHPQWWEIVASFGPMAVLLAAGITAWIGWKSLDQKAEADRAALEQKAEADERSQWWERAQWALDASLSDDPFRKEIGLGVLDLLARSKLAGEEEAALIKLAAVDNVAKNGFRAPELPQRKRRWRSGR
jgi:hypothetical protein